MNLLPIESTTIVKSSWVVCKVFVLFFCAPSILAEGIRAFSTDAQTSQQSQVSLEASEEIAESLERSTGVHLGDLGGFGKLRTIGFRGSRARSTGIFLEGIRLNSPATGEFDLSQLSSFGLGPALLVRGPQTTLSTQPSGQVLLSLPQKQEYRSSILLGSYGYWGFAQLAPFGSVSYEQAKNDFEYYERGQRRTRNHNFVRRLNARAWHREENYQVWGQVLFLDQDIPGATTFPTPNAESQALTTTIATQLGRRRFNSDFWIQLHDIRYSDQDAPLKTENQILSTGIRLKHRATLSKSLSLYNQIQLDQDKLFSSMTSSPVRWVPSWTLRAPLYIGEDGLIQPQMRVEYVSDLEKPFSIHPSLGLRYQVSRGDSLYGNLAYISRAPTFNEMYFESPPSISNPDLKRQRSLLADLAYEARRERFRFTQAFFYERATNYLQSVTLADGGFQIQNQGVLLSVGSETEAQMTVYPWVRFNFKHTYLRAQLGGRELPLQPQHQWHLIPEFFGDTNIRLKLPFSIQTRAKTWSGSELPWQFDLGLKFTANWRELRLNLSVFNLLGTYRIQTPDYPLPQRPWIRTSLTWHW